MVNSIEKFHKLSTICYYTERAFRNTFHFAFISFHCDHTKLFKSQVTISK